MSEATEDPSERPAGEEAPPEDLILRLAEVARFVLARLFGDRRARQVVGYLYAVSTLLVYSYRTQHGRAYLGMLWVLLTPFLFLVVYVPLFAQFAGTAKGVEEYLGTGQLAFPIYVVLGFIAYTAVSEAVSGGASALVGDASVVQNSPIPLSILPLVKALRASIGLTVSVVIVVILLSVLGQFPGLRLLLFPVALFLVSVFSLGVALLLSAVAVFFRDLLQVLPTLLLIEFFAIPILYLPNLGGAKTQLVMQANPVTPYLALIRASCFAKYPLTALDLGLAVFWALVMFLFGALVFRKLEGNLAEHT